ncbi:tetratricopeptide (TPR) repeat protein/transcriptional regulator with XRE-family HTH domain [Allocatelliglobosispora scoriae]|uniref:Tetratricopeptide (TPR) repeat protein/transcriptional regulator with XRE-family HTH domain n=1 Tax=Allocatelliglobosispora scoriae TaxID=643052 RepID=A0A841BNG8_9ACTN|nr:helix-turn-helix domain-containing protein [Allocatelliglobosispora scoriae]MBB5868836.1 tetratricopeptide (TPR) repeat protein/transcriptional regulator with XRE-family HTH domain [Allocatelliglobosispora scoriae]
MIDERSSALILDVRGVETVLDLARLLRQLRRRQAHLRRGSELTYRELTALTGWSIGTIAGYLSGRTLPPVDRFDVLIRVLDASPVEQGILATLRDNVAERRRPPQSSAGPGWPIPRQLPADVFRFTGRAAHLAELDALLHSPGPSPTVVVSALSGTAGVGKTALAVHWAQRVSARFPDGQLYVNLRGFDPSGPPMSVTEAVRGFLDAFGVDAQRIPLSVEAQVGLYRSLIADRRVLVLLDNARDADQVRPLLPGSPGCLTLVTSRNQLASLVVTEGARPIILDLLSQREARQLLANRLGGPRVLAEPEAVDQLIERCACLPLALAIIAARASTRPSLSLAVLAQELLDTQGRLDPFAGDDAVVDVRAVFSHSYQDLSAAAATMFRLLGGYPGPDIAAPAAASLAAVPLPAARAMLAELVSANLLHEHVPGRYTCHDLLRAYAGEQSRAADTEADRRAATRRLLDHYLQTANAAALMIYAQRDPIMLVPPADGVTAELVSGQENARAWFAAEHATMLAVIDQAADQGFAAHTWQLAWAIGDVLDWRGQWIDLAAVQATALRAAQQAGDIAGAAQAHRILARAYIRLGRWGDAATLLAEAVLLFDRVGDPVGQANSHIALSRVHEEHGDHRSALEQSQQALGLFRAAGHQAGQARSLNAVGWYHALLAEYEAAVDCCEQALALHRAMGSRLGQAPAWDSLGYAHQHLGHHQEAIACYQSSIELYREVGDRFHEGDTLVHLGDNYQQSGAADLAQLSWRQALEIFTALNHPAAEDLRRKLG